MGSNIKTKDMYNKSRIFKSAIFYLREGLFPDWSTCLKRAWKREKIIALMDNGPVMFEYAKLSGEQRLAIGTLKGTTIENSLPTVLTYFDLEKDAIRRARVENITSYTN